jgi:hypothetical protein
MDHLGLLIVSLITQWVRLCDLLMTQWGRQGDLLMTQWGRQGDLLMTQWVRLCTNGVINGSYKLTHCH